MRAALAVIVVAVSAGTAAAGGAVLIPPLEIAMGANAPVGVEVTAGHAMELQVGMHWASLAWKPTRLDIGVGYVGSSRVLEPGWSTAGRFDDVRDDRELAMHGGYLHLATTLASARHWRTWIAARGELMRADDGMRDFSVLGAALRIASEVYVAGAAGDRNALAIGTLALGIYVEASYRDLPAAYGPAGLVTGLSARVPFLLAGS
jgi:hypothetical protein